MPRRGSLFPSAPLLTHGRSTPAASSLRRALTHGHGDALWLGAAPPPPPTNVRELATQRQPLQLGHAARSGCRGELIALFALLAYTTVGAVWFKLAPGASMADISWVASFYFAVTTVTTVGYGDLNPAAEQRPWGVLAGQLLYILVGVVVIGAALSHLMGEIIERPLKARSLRVTLALAVGIFVALVGAGAAIEGAIEGWTAIDSIYWAIVTVTTVGYGYVVPTTEGGRAFAAVFMLAGVSSATKLIADVVSLPLAAHQARLQHAVLHQYGEELEEEELWELAAGEQVRALGLSQSDHYVTKNEFCLAMLVRMEKISEEDLRSCQAAFAKLDATETGRLDQHDLREHKRRSAARRASADASGDAA